MRARGGHRTTVRAGPACREHMNPGPELGDLEPRIGKGAVDRQADLGQAGRSCPASASSIALSSCSQLVMSSSCVSGAMGCPLSPELGFGGRTVVHAR